jgi:hypothetical protein
MEIDAMFSAIRHPQAKPSERCVRKIGKFCLIYCKQAYKGWPELLSQGEGWLHVTLLVSTGYSSVELIVNSPRPDLFEEFVKKGPEQKPPAGSLQEKDLKAYVKMKEKAEKRMKRGKEL